MQRQITSNDDLNNNNNTKTLHELQEQVISFLEERESSSESCQLLLAEIQMLVAMFEEAKVHFMIKSNNQVNNMNTRNLQDGKNGGHLVKKEEQDKEDTNSETVPAINVSVPLQTLQGDGESTLASVLLSIVLEEPHLFPNSNEIAIRFKSTQLSPQLRSDLADDLLKYAKELQEAESLTIASLASRAEEMLLNLPVSSQSKYFGCCLNCNKVQLIKGLSKAPAPLKLLMDDKENLLFSKREDVEKNDDEDEDEGGGEKNNAHQETNNNSELNTKHKSVKQLLEEEEKHRTKSDKEAGCPTTATDVVTATMKKQKQLKESKPNQCLMCKSDLIIFVPSMKPTKKTECSFCYCEDHPLLSFPNCSCVSCFDCFIRLAEIAVGERKIKRPIFGYMGFGIPCPSHPRDSLLNDPGLMKMLPRRSFFRFNAFAAKDFVMSIGGFTCANPRCESGLPQVSTLMKTGLTICFYCSRATCLSCGHESINCECKKLVMAERTPLREVKERIFRDNAGGRLPVMCPFYEGDVLFVIGKDQKILSVPLDSPDWKNYCDAYVWQEFVPSRKLPYSSYIGVFNGAPLNPQWPLSRSGVHPGAIVYLIPFVDLGGDELKDEIELWNFRRAVAKGREDGGAAQRTADEKFLADVTKKCPNCNKPTLHYRGHGCHHLSCSCGTQWCFGCGGHYPCHQSPRCSVFCNHTCDCKLCPDCKPFSPCSLCMGCDNCRPQSGGEKFS